LKSLSRRGFEIYYDAIMGVLGGIYDIKRAGANIYLVELISYKDAPALRGGSWLYDPEDRRILRHLFFKGLAFPWEDEGLGNESKVLRA